MNTFSRLTVACAASLALGSVTAIAHHSAAAFNTQKEVTVNGTVKSYRFANPHVQLIVTVKKDDGSAVDMDVEAGAASVNIHVPESAAARIRVKEGVSAVSVDTNRFPRLD